MVEERFVEDGYSGCLSQVGQCGFYPGNKSLHG